MTHDGLRLGSVADAEQAGEAIVACFAEDPLSHWVVPDVRDWPTVLQGYFSGAAAGAAKDGSLYILRDFEAVALWFDVTEPPPPPPERPTAEFAELCGRYTERFHTLEHLFHQVHPAGPPHQQLGFLVVRPHLRSQGIGSHLLDVHHRLLDEAGLPAYLDAASPRSRDLYLRHGYVDLPGPYFLPDGPPVWPMWRAPGGTG